MCTSHAISSARHTYIAVQFDDLVFPRSCFFALRLIYWLCLSLGSSVRGLGFGLSFFPMVVMLAANLYFVSSSKGPEAVFDVAPPTTAPPPQQRWWG